MEKSRVKNGIPVIAKADILVVGGTLSGAACAAAAARAGAKVFLAAQESYLGDDICAPGALFWKRPAASSAGGRLSELTAALFPEDLPDAGDGRVFLPPLHVKSVLDEALVRSGATFRFLSVPHSALVDRSGRLAGLVFATKSGFYGVRARIVVDATFNGAFAASLPKALRSSFLTLPGSGAALAEFPVRALRAVVIRPAAAGRPDVPGARREGAFDASRWLSEGGGGGVSSDPSASMLEAWSVTEDLPRGVSRATPERLADRERRLRAKIWSRDLSWISDRCELVLDVEPDSPESVIAKAEAAAAGLADSAGAAAEPDGPLSPARPASAEIRRRAPVACTDPRAERDAIEWTEGVPDLLSGVRIREVDFLVVGGGTAGAPAAIAAARHGADVLCVEALDVLGGTATAGSIANYWHGYREGFTAECREAMSKIKGGWADGGYCNPSWKSRWMEEELRACGASVWFGAVAAAALVSGRRVEGAVVVTRWGVRVVRARLVLDASGNADLAALAGAPVRNAWEEDFVFQGSGLHARPAMPGWRNSDWTFILDSDIADQTRAFVAGRRKFAGGFEMNKLVGTRERRQIVGDVTLTPLDVYLDTFRPDAVARCSSNFDTHGMTTFPLFNVLPPTRAALAAWLPMGALLPRGWTGVAVTGLAISAQRDVMPVMRMIADVQNQAWSVGVAAAWLAAAGCRDFRKTDFPRLHRAMVEYHLNLPESVLLAPPGGPDGLAHALPSALAGPLSTHGEAALALAHPDASRKALSKSVHDRRADAGTRLRRALLLAVMNDPAGEPELLASLAGAKRWDEGWNYRGMGQFCRSESPLDDVITCLGRIGSKKAAPDVLRLGAKMGADTELSHIRAFSSYAEALAADPALRAKFVRLLSARLSSGPLHVWPAVSDELAATDGDWCSTSSRNDSLKELFLARALYRCGDDAVGTGEKALRAYAADVRGQFAAAAWACLKR